jgi:hypothetical protein
MKAVAQAHKNRNLQEFETALAIYTKGKVKERCYRQDAHDEQ